MANNINIKETLENGVRQIAETFKEQSMAFVKKIASSNSEKRPELRNTNALLQKEHGKLTEIADNSMQAGAKLAQTKEIRKTPLPEPTKNPKAQPPKTGGPGQSR